MQERSLWPCSTETPWFLHSERDQRALADHRLRVLYKERERTPTKPLGKVQNSDILHI